MLKLQLYNTWQLCTSDSFYLMMAVTGVTVNIEHLTSSQWQPNDKWQSCVMGLDLILSSPSAPRRCQPRSCRRGPSWARRWTAALSGWPGRGTILQQVTGWASCLSRPSGKTGFDKSKIYWVLLLGLENLGYPWNVQWRNKIYITITS